MTKFFWKGHRVKLRAVEPSDWEFFFASAQDSESLQRSYHIPFSQSQEATKQWTQELATKATQDPQNDSFRWVIENHAGEPVGTINTTTCDRRHGIFGYGLGINQEHQRKGYASEAIMLVLRYFFQELGYQKVTVDVYEFNEPSIRLHERIGFQLEGRIRRMIFTEGQYFDILIFGMTVDEFKATYAQETSLKRVIPNVM
jgi:RimJ/RimL family protein N-acetyltransferase